MSGLIQKPVDMNTLAMALGALLDDRSPKQNSPASVPAAGPGESTYVDSKQISQLIELLGRDKLSERITTLIEKMDDELPALTEATNIEDLRQRAHGIAGICGMFGATYLPEVWEETQKAWSRQTSKPSP